MFLVKYQITFVYSNGQVETSDKIRTEEFETIEEVQEFRETRESLNRENLNKLQSIEGNKVEFTYSNFETEVM